MAENLIITVLIPAWNEEETIAHTLKSLYRQTRQPDHIVVIPNNTTDHTAEQSWNAGAEVLVMPGENKKKKAGALNFALDELASKFEKQNNPAILVMDADTILEDNFIERAELKMLEEVDVGGVSSIFVGRESKTIIGTLQAMEYARYGLIAFHRPEVFVLSGTASLIRWEAIKKIKAARIVGKTLPKGEGYYDVDSLTEDNELTLAMLVVGYSVPHCGIFSVTDVMEDFKSLRAQRKRWCLGALQNIGSYGLQMPLWMISIYWFQQIGLYIAMAMVPVVLGIFVLSIIFSMMGMIKSSVPMYTIFLFGVYVLTQVMTVWQTGWRGRIVAALYIPEFVYSLMLIYFYAVALLEYLKTRGRNTKWQHT